MNTRKTGLPDRSYLFVPANKLNLIQKALKTEADALILDLEDGVPPPEKEAARENLCSLPKPSEMAKPVYIRVNDSMSQWFDPDMEAVERLSPSGIMLPKAETREQVDSIAEATHDSVSVLPLIETAQGLVNAPYLAGAKSVERLAFGTVDFQLDVCIDDDEDGLLYARSQLVIASRASGLQPPIDGVATALTDESSIRYEACRARELGFGAKLCIHPFQTDIVNRAFEPTEKQLAWAERIVNATKNVDGGPLALDGEVIDRPILERARWIVTRSERRSATSRTCPD